MGRTINSRRPRSVNHHARDHTAQVHPVKPPINGIRTLRHAVPTRGASHRTDTFLSSAGPAEREELLEELAAVSNHPVVDGLLDNVGGLMAVLNEHHQIISVNDAFLKSIGIEDAESVLGMRLGEAICCVRSHETPGGCGASDFCPSCGAAIAIVACLGTDRAEERTCFATLERNGQKAFVEFKVRSYPLTVNQRRIILLFMRDKTANERRAEPERSFYQDINDVVSALADGTEKEADGSANDADDVADRIKMLTSRLSDEAAMQRVLSEGDIGEYRPDLQWVSVSQVIRELREVFANHPASAGRMLIIRASACVTRIRTDISILIRVLCNMVVNALEATEDDGTVRLWVEGDHTSVEFRVWNGTLIPRDTALRIFQRDFSTKKGAGRGMGTWAMRLFCENYLRAEVEFTTSESDGTVFRVRIPNGAID